MPDREQQVRDIAHRLWEEEGRPRDQEKRHWHAAERIVAAEEMASRAEAQQARPTGTVKRRTERKGAKRSASTTHAATTQTH